jgi:predicted transcriptional regulator
MYDLRKSRSGAVAARRVAEQEWSMMRDIDKVKKMFQAIKIEE